MIKAIVFDFDGVLVESVDVKTQAFAALYEKYGQDIVDKVVAHHLAHGGVSRYEKFRHYSREFLGKELDKDEEYSLGMHFSQLVEDAVVNAQFVPGAKEFLEQYYQKLILYVVSGTPDEELKRIVERRNMRHYFKGVYGSPEKKGVLIKQILQYGNYVQDRVLMVGDAITDYKGAVEAGVRFVGRIKDGSTNYFSDISPVISNLEELSNVL